MNELNQKMSESLGLLLFGVKEEVIQGLQEYWLLCNKPLSAETI